MLGNEPHLETHVKKLKGPFA